MEVIMKQVQTTLQAGFEAGLVSTQTHENIEVNPTLTAADFVQ
jgi:hypothetical protein